MNTPAKLSFFSTPGVGGRLFVDCSRGGVIVADDPSDGDRLGKNDGVGGVLKLCVGGTLPAVIFNLSSDKVGLLSGAAFMIFSPTPFPSLFDFCPAVQPFPTTLCVEHNKLNGEVFPDTDLLLGEMS